MIKRTNWNEIINNNPESILVIGYWSLLNKKTHHNWTKILWTVEAKYFKRTFDLPYEENKYNYATNRANKVLNKKELNTIKNPICQAWNDWALNCHYTWDEKDLINWLLIRIKKEEFQWYKEREYLYNLYPTDYYYVNPETWMILEKSKEQAYILVAKDWPWIKKSRPFESYNKICELGAYSWWKYFWDTYNKTTFY